MNITKFTSSNTHEEFVLHLIEERKVPENGWNTRLIEYILSYLSSMDCNNFPNKASVGEREGRCFSELIARRNYYFTHGIGRSGNLTEPQPKAIGSSILYKVTNDLVKDLLSSGDECLLVPTTIGVSIMLCLSTFRLIRKVSHVLWLREDNEAVFKSIINAGFQVTILPTSDLLKENIRKIGPNNITCIISSSCSSVLYNFPRDPFDLKEIGKICDEYKIPHIINNNCGLQSKDVMDKINEISESSRVDVVIQNAGENFMVPVGSTLLTSRYPEVLGKIANTYPGRASINSVIDIFITILSLGKKGFKERIEDRENLYKYFVEQLTRLHKTYSDFISSLQSTPLTIGLCFKNDVSIDISKIDHLFKHCCHIMRVNVVGKIETLVLGTYEFKDWGTNGHPCSTPYITFEIPLGTSKEEVTLVIEKLEMILCDIKNN